MSYGNFSIHRLLTDWLSVEQSMLFVAAGCANRDFCFGRIRSWRSKTNGQFNIKRDNKFNPVDSCPCIGWLSRLAVGVMDLFETKRPTETQTVYDGRDTDPQLDVRGINGSVSSFIKWVQLFQLSFSSPGHNHSRLCVGTGVLEGGPSFVKQFVSYRGAVLVDV